MTRKIIASAIAALAIGTFTAAPRVAEATVVAGSGAAMAITADVLATAIVTDTAPATLSEWTASADTMTFSVGVTQNDGNGYTFAFADTYGFKLKGSGTNYSTFTITGPDSQTYSASGIAGTAVGTSVAANTSANYTFTINLGSPSGLIPDSYNDSITATVTPVS